MIEGRRQWHPTLVLLAGKIPWMEKPGKLQSMGSLRVGHDWATSLSLFTFMHWRRKWQPTPVFLPRESQGQRSLVAAVCGVAQSRTRLKRLSSSSNDWRCWVPSHIFSFCVSSLLKYLFILFDHFMIELSFIMFMFSEFFILFRYAEYVTYKYFLLFCSLYVHPLNRISHQ